MKKTLAILIICFSILPLFAYDAILSPYNGAYGVNVGSKRYSTEIDTNLPNSGWVSGTPVEGEKTYSNDGIVVMGEVSNFTLDENEDFLMRVTVNTDNNFNFVSLSNPSYYRPYTLTVIGKCDNTKFGDNQSFVGKKELEANKSNVAIFRYRENKSGKTPSGSADSNSMWFDMVLGLPVKEITTSGLLTLPSGQQLVLGRVDDYASFVTVTMEYGKIERDTGVPIGTPEVIIMSIPFSGYYRADNSHHSDEATASLHVDTYAKASALNIDGDAKREIEIADVRFAFANLVTFSGNTPQSSETQNASDYVNSLRLFISASADPFVMESDGFRLVHKDYKIGDPVNDYNSVPFTIIARSEETKEAVEFDGRTYVSDGANVVGTSIKPSVHSGENTFTHTKYTTFFAEYVGSLGIYIDYDGYIMKPGLYEEDVYIHVISGV